jgi:DNA-binding MarR family transcriptional regulator
MSQPPGLGTLLRHLIELLDGEVQQVYERSGLQYRPRYTPIVRALAENGPSSIRAIAARAQITHSAASQTLARMVQDGLVRFSRGGDGRERIVTATERLREMLPALERSWSATAAAADELDGELSVPLSKVVREAITALQRKSFGERIRSHHEDKENP